MLIARQTKSSIQGFLKGIGLYHRIKSSRLYDLYWKTIDQKLIHERDKEIEFYRLVLKGFQQGCLIYDIGANQGYKTDIFLRLGAKVVSVDPDEANQKILRQRFHNYRFIRKPVFIVGKAVSDSNSHTTLWIEKPGSAKNTLSTKWVETLSKDDIRFGHPLNFIDKKEVETITLERLITDYGMPFFIKIDVEGHELSVLSGMNRSVPYLSFEINLPEFRLEGLRCLELLNKISNKGKFNYIVDCQRGLELESWLPLQKFVGVFERLKVPSVEVFWKTQTDI